VANRYSIHAEQDCISKCPKKLISKATMLLVRETCMENVLPCSSCKKIIEKYKIKRVYCTNIVM
jgi:deoxycytidylate deaminase